MRWSFRWILGVAASSAYVGASLWSSAYAKDLEMLTRLLIPAYMAQNFAALCVDQDAQLPAEVNDGTALAGAFAEHVKAEVTLGLPEVDAGNVRTAAADTALHVARQELRLLTGDGSSVRDAALKKWCGSSAKHFIVEIMNKHREKHEEFQTILEAAKR